MVLPMPGASTESIRVTIDGSADEIVLEATEAPLWDVLRRIGHSFGVDIRGADRIDVSRKITGRKAGPLVDVLRWLMPDTSFELVHDDGKPGPDGLPPLASIAILGIGSGQPAVDTASGQAAPHIARGQSTPTPQAAQLTDAELARMKPPVAASLGATGQSNNPDDANVAGLLRRNTAQAGSVLSGRPEARTGTVPPHLHADTDAAQVSIDDALARTTMLAQKNLAALRQALRTACIQGKCD
jgi:hypothetical protein